MNIFTYGKPSDPPPPSYDSSEESVTPKVNPTPHNNQHNTIQNVPANLDSDPGFSDSSLLDSFDSSYDEYSKQGQLTKKSKNKHQNKTRVQNPIKKCANLTATLIISV